MGTLRDPGSTFLMPSSDVELHAMWMDGFSGGDPGDTGEIDVVVDDGDTGDGTGEIVIVIDGEDETGRIDVIVGGDATSGSLNVEAD